MTRSGLTDSGYRRSVGCRLGRFSGNSWADVGRRIYPAQGHCQFSCKGALSFLWRLPRVACSSNMHAWRYTLLQRSGLWLALRPCRLLLVYAKHLYLFQLTQECFLYSVKSYRYAQRLCQSARGPEGSSEGLWPRPMSCGWILMRFWRLRQRLSGNSCRNCKVHKDPSCICRLSGIGTQCSIQLCNL